MTVEYEELSHEQWREMFDSTCEKLLGIPGPVFEVKLDHEDIKDLDHCEAIRVAILRPDRPESRKRPEYMQALADYYQSRRGIDADDWGDPITNKETT